MKSKAYLTVFVLLAFTLTVFAQKPNFYQTTIFLKDSVDYNIGLFFKKQSTDNGHLYQVQDSSLTLAEFKYGPSRKRFKAKKYTTKDIMVGDIDKIILQKEHNPFAIPLMGFATGTVLGSTIGYSCGCFGNPDSFGGVQGSSALAGAFFGSGIGLLGGIILKSALYRKYQYELGGSQKNYDNHKSSMKEKSLMF